MAGALPAERIMGVKPGAARYTVIREDASINLEAVDRHAGTFPDADIVFIESGGDNLAATFSPELSDLTLYVIDVAGGENSPQGRPRHHQVRTCSLSTKPIWRRWAGASLAIMEEDTRRMRGPRPYVMSDMKAGTGLAEIKLVFIEKRGLLAV